VRKLLRFSSLSTPKKTSPVHAADFGLSGHLSARPPGPTSRCVPLRTSGRPVRLPAPPRPGAPVPLPPSRCRRPAAAAVPPPPSRRRRPSRRRPVPPPPPVPPPSRRRPAAAVPPPRPPSLLWPRASGPPGTAGDVRSSWLHQNFASRSVLSLDGPSEGFNFRAVLATDHREC